MLFFLVNENRLFEPQTAALYWIQIGFKALFIVSWLDNFMSVKRQTLTELVVATSILQQCCQIINQCKYIQTEVTKEIPGENQIFA